MSCSFKLENKYFDLKYSEPMPKLRYSIFVK